MSNTHPLFIFVVLSTVLGGVISNSVYAQEDWQRAASAAGLDESGLGAPTQRSMLIKQQLQKAEAERAAREKTYTAQKAKQDHAQKVIAEANKNLKTVTDNYGQSLATQQQLIQGIQERAAQTQARKKSAETALKKLGTINRYNPFSDESDKRVKLQAEIDDATSTLKAQSKHLKERLTKFNTTRKEAESLANQYKMQAIKSLPEQKAAEEKRRLDALKEYRQEYDTTAAKMVEADKRFDAKSKYLKTKISEAKKSGKGTTVYENALADLKINQDAFLQSYSGRLTTIKRDLNRQYSDNKRDGLGISSPVKLDEVLQSEANAAGRGGDGPRLINQAALSSANASVNRTITSKNTNSQHINVFDNPDSLAAWEEFGTDVRTEYVSSLKDQYNLVGQAKAIEKAITTGDTSDLKKQNRLLGRSIAVAKGGTLGVKDAVVGTVEFAYSGIKFTVQSSAVAVDTYSDWLGSKTDLTSVFGKDAAELGWKGVAGANDILYGMTAGELFNDKSAKQLSIANSESLLGMLVDKPYDKFSREFEKAAASGETGIQKGVEKFTQAGVNVIGGEEAIFGAIIKTGSGAAKLFNKADVLADVSKQAFLKLDLDSPLVRNLDLGPIPELPPRRLGPLPGDEGVLNIPVVASSKIERPKAPATGKAAMIDGVDGAKIYKAPDGSIFELGEVIGTGSTSTTYAVKGQPDRVVKITKKAESGENLNAYAGDVLDDIGTNLVKGIDPNLLPQQIGSKQTLNARESVTVLERFDDVKKFQEASTAASGVARHEVKMTNGQLRAYREMMDKLNDKGVVFMDNKLDNWSLVKVEGKLDSWEAKIIDPGSMVIMESPEVARKAQQFLDKPDQSIKDIYRSEKAAAMGEQAVKVGRDRAGGYQAEEFLAEFGDKIDKKAMQKAGKGRLDPDFEMKDIPFHPAAGLSLENLAEAHGDWWTLAKSDREAAIDISNMVPEHAEALSRVAQASDKIIMIRPVNPHSTKRIAQDAATKGMNIKGKSADWGPHAGTIPVDPKFSKMGVGPDGKSVKKNFTPAELKKLQEYENLNRKALGEEYLDIVRGKDGKPVVGPDGKFVYETIPADKSRAIAQRLEVEGPDGKMIEVLATLDDPPRPITADYDLFAVGSKEDFGKLLRDHPEMGNISEVEMALLGKFNKAVNETGHKGGNVAHHGAANRYAKELEAADFPIAVATPDGGFTTLHSTADLKKFRDHWQAKGYEIPAYDTWHLGDAFPKRPDAKGRTPRNPADGTAKRNADGSFQWDKQMLLVMEYLNKYEPYSVLWWHYYFWKITNAAIEAGEETSPVDELMENANDVIDPNVPIDRVVTGGGSGGSGAETEISIGGGFFFPTTGVPDIFFGFGPRKNTGGEEEEFWVSIGEDAEVELISTVNYDGINVFESDVLNRFDFFLPDGTFVVPPGGGGSPPVPMISVLFFNGHIIPVNRAGLRIGNPESPITPTEGCAERHYHGGPVDSCAGVSVSDTRARGCGYGVVSSVRLIPITSCLNP